MSSPIALESIIVSTDVSKAPKKPKAVLTAEEGAVTVAVLPAPTAVEEDGLN